MTELNPVAAKRRWLPQLRSRWWTLILGLSLMLNLLVAGLAIGLRLDGGPVERLIGASYIQLIPRSFLRELPHERRRELMAIVKQRSDTLRALRESSQTAPLLLATTLENPAATASEIKAAVDSFTIGAESLAAGGGAVVLEIVGKLTQEERRALAAAIRERAQRSTRRKQN
jgi:Heavy-metal resistance